MVDKPLIEYAVDEALDAGIEEFIFVTGRGKSAIENHFDVHYELEQTLLQRGKTGELDAMNYADLEPGQIAYVRQMSPLGLGHAVWCARHLVNDEPFAVLLADDLIKAERSTLGEMIDVYEQRGGNVVSLMEVPAEHTSRYGIVTPGDDDGSVVEIKGLVEKPAPSVAPSNLAVVGRYILQPAVMDELTAATSGAGGEIQLTDSMARLIGRSPFNGLRLNGTRFDCGTKIGFLSATVAYALARPDLGDEFRAAVTALLE